MSMGCRIGPAIPASRKVQVVVKTIAPIETELEIEIEILLSIEMKHFNKAEVLEKVGGFILSLRQKSGECSSFVIANTLQYYLLK